MRPEPDFSGRRVLVTGGCGFIGSHTVDRLLELGAEEVIALDSMRFGKRENLESGSDPRVTVLEHELGKSDIRDLDGVLERTDDLVHLAAMKHNQSRDEPDEVVQANVVGTYELLREATERKVKRAVFSSSLYAYGRLVGPAMQEDGPATPRTIYGITKLTGEHLTSYAASQGLPSVSLRYFFVYGPRQYAKLGYKSVIVKTLERLAQGVSPVVYGDGEQSLDYSYVTDVVDATLLAVSKAGDAPALINVGSGKARSVNELMDAMLELTGSDRKPEAAPADWTAGTCRRADTARLGSALGYEPQVELQDGLARTYAWIKQRGAS